MKTKEIINQCSNIEYWSKSQIIAKYSEKHWNEVRNYRDHIRTNLHLFNSANEEITFVLTPYLATVEINLHRDINKLARIFYIYEELVKTHNLTSEKHLRLKKVHDEVIGVLLQGYSLKIDELSLERILHEKQRPRTNAERLASEYFRFLYGLSTPQLHSSMYKNICDFNARISNSAITHIFRSEVKKKQKVRHIMVTNRPTIDYYGFRPIELVKRISMLDYLFDANHQTTLFSTAVLVYYYIKYGFFFKKYNEISAIAGMYLIITHSYGEIAGMLQLGQIIIKNYKTIKASLNTAMDSYRCDITVVCYEFVKIIQNHLASEIMTMTVAVNKIIQQHETNNSPNKIDLTIRAHNLCSSNLQITLRQAEFFLTHNTIGHSYTIKDFRIYTHSSYETSRYSLENLVKNNFYVKKKYKKKFVYRVYLATK